VSIGAGLRERTKGMFSAMEVPNYRLLFAGRVTSNAGRTLRVFARAIWVFEATGSPLRMGIAVSALSWPMLFMPLVGGIVADRVNRKTLLLWTEGLLVILWAVVSLFITLGLFEWWYFIITAVASGTIQSFGRAGLQAMIGTIVDDKRLGNAVALDSISLVWPRIAAPALGGVLVGPLGVGALFWMTAAGQLITFVTLLFIHWTPQEMKAAKDSVGNNVLEALRHIRGETVIMSLVALGLLSALFAGSFNFLLPIFASEILDAGNGGLGILMTSAALGGALGSIMVLAASNARRHRGLLLIGMAVVKTAMLIVFSQSTILPISVVAMFGLGGSQVVFMTTVTMAMQQLAPDHLRGRIMSLRVVIMGFSPFGVIIMGFLAEARGAADTVLIGGLLYGVSALVLFILVPTLRRFQ
jgi:predicted MFS family arabinose efflux permease